MINNEEEIWKALPGVPGVEVSTFGNVRTLDRLVSTEKRTQFTKGHILKQYKTHDGYLQVSIPIDGKWTVGKIHRVIAQTFIPNPENLPQVNHLDCDRTNNNVSNLEWCTASYNAKYREKNGVLSAEARGHPVLAVNLVTLEVLHFRAQREASRKLGVYRQNIDKVIKGRYKQTGGFWFTNDDENIGDAIKIKLNEIKHRTAN